MAAATTDPQLSDTQDMRNYILAMLIELATLAEAIEDRQLAGQLRDLVWPPESLNRFSGASKL